MALNMFMVFFVLPVQTLEMARNPAVMQEMMRNQDRALSNLEVNIALLACNKKKRYPNPT